jgi:competence protein ComEA
VKLRVALAVAVLWGAAAARGSASPTSSVAPPSCSHRVQVFDGLSSLLTCDDRLPDGTRFAAGTRARMAGPALRLLGLPVDVNRATVEDLQSLPGVGPKLAERIAAARPFVRTSDLLQVPGIGPKRFAELSGAVVVMDPESRRQSADHL